MSCWASTGIATSDERRRTRSIRIGCLLEKVTGSGGILRCRRLDLEGWRGSAVVEDLVAQLGGADADLVAAAEERMKCTRTVEPGAVAALEVLDGVAVGAAIDADVM